MNHLPSPRVPLLPFIALLVGGMSIGFAGIFMRLSDVNPIASAFWRVALAAPCLWGWALYSRVSLRPAQPTPFAAILAWAGFFFAGDMALWHSALHETTVANATLLSNFAPLFIVLFIWKTQKIRFSFSFILGLVLAMAGAALLVLGKIHLPDHLTTEHHPMLGNLLGLISALFYAGYQLAIKEARHHYPTSILMAWSSTVTSLFLLPLALMSPGHFFPQHLSAWLPLLGLAFIAQIGGQTVIAFASAHLPTALSSVGLLVQPLTAAIAAWILFQEQLSLPQIMGGGLLLYGIYLSRKL
jgi:drug/metabolite transporter (DMT)-like permease